MTQSNSAMLTEPLPNESKSSSCPVSELDPAALIILRCRLALLRRLAWLQYLWGGPTAPEEWGWQIDHPDTPGAEQTWAEEAAEAVHINAMLRQCSAALAGEKGRGRARLTGLFNLAPEETDALDLAFALHEEPALAPMIQAVTPHADRVRINEALVRQVFLHQPCGTPLWRPGSGLSVWGLLKEQAGGLVIDAAIASYLKGALSLDPLLVSYARLADAPWNLPYWQIDHHAAQLDRILSSGRLVRCLIRARRGDKPLNFAARLCRDMGIRLLSVVIPAGADATTLAQVAIRAERLALLGNFAIAWQGFDWRFHPAALSATPLQFHFSSDGESPPALSGTNRLDWTIDLPPPAQSDRLNFCQQAHASGLSTLNPQDLNALAGFQAATLDDLEATLGKAPQNQETALSFLSECLTRHDEMAGRISLPRRDWTDIVLPEATLQTLKDIVFEACDRRNLAESGHGGGGIASGMPVLLHGTPGTGKTLAAEVVASKMGCSLYTVDVASIVSKYVGETAKNLRQIFFEARNSGNVIFFDEADTFFVKRTEVRGANDKHANADTNYLLQLIEAHPGTTILATNRRADIDPAFFRRMRFILELTRPASTQRQQLWNHCLGQLDLKPDTLPEGFLDALAQSVELSPAQIRNVATSTFFMARQQKQALSTALMLRALTRELTKEGRAVGQRDLQRMARYE